ncbi:hypothetical protein G3I60_05065 [Streptomyces sp. SID13666]|uniref:hypothetical protein n=1 Tax=Streptomyces sp. SID13666 TaxID=2706054 RepID=UPI0013C1C2BB|nr:hypothetical protein [Streptomyces sp. SID13666]NEA53540.1 hypothetical protein [Streptomyces sp. SID13666]
MKRAQVRCQADASRLLIGPFQILTARIPKGPRFAYGRIATSAAGCDRAGAPFTVDYDGVTVVIAGVAFAVLRRGAVMAR